MCEICVFGCVSVTLWHRTNRIRCADNRYKRNKGKQINKYDVKCSNPMKPKINTKTPKIPL